MRVSRDGRSTVRASLPNCIFPPRNLGRTLEYPINPTIRDIAIANQQYQNNLHNYPMVNNMSIALNKIVIVAIGNQWIKG